METPTLRLFFALWPPPEIARTLNRIARNLARDGGGRAMREETLHVTLDFVGSVPAGLLPAIEAAAASLHAPTFPLRLDRLEHLARKGIVWAGCEETPAALAELATALKAALRERCGLEPEKRFVPHLTLLRNVRAVPVLPAIPPLDWTIGDFRLFRSELRADGARYTEVGRWMLTR